MPAPTRPTEALCGLAAGAVAGLVSGAPSTTAAVVTGRDPLEAVRAAGSLVGSPTLGAGAVVHVAVSLAWGVALAAVLPRRRSLLWGAAAGAAIAALDLGVVARRFPRIRELPSLPQVADHVAYGAVVGAVLSDCRSR
ncbi:MAG: hypothetical protein M3378_04825 [Actinomycetota bacterium]|nr:hypothetical protein [Actinomycetota bacterium]